MTISDFKDYVRYSSLLYKIYWKIHYLLDRYIFDRGYDWEHLDFLDGLATFLDKSSYVKDYIIFCKPVEDHYDDDKHFELTISYTER